MVKFCLEVKIVYFDEELAHDFGSGITGNSMEPRYQNSSGALIREIGFDYDGAVYVMFKLILRKFIAIRRGYV